jgi:hypothetical protein
MSKDGIRTRAIDMTEPKICLGLGLRDKPDLRAPYI